MKWRKVCAGQYESTDDQYWLIHHKHYDARAREGVNILVRRSDGGWDCDNCARTFREAKKMCAESAVDGWREQQ